MKYILLKIRNFILIIFKVIFGIFSSDDTSSKSSKQKDIKKETNKKDELNIKDNITTNRDEDNEISFTSKGKSYIEFNKEFKKSIESITGLKISTSTYSEEQEIKKVKEEVKKVIEEKESKEYFSSKEEEVKFLNKVVLKETINNKRLPIKKEVQKQEVVIEIKKEDKKEEVKETKEEIKKPIIKEPTKVVKQEPVKEPINEIKKDKPKQDFKLNPELEESIKQSVKEEITKIKTGIKEEKVKEEPTPIIEKPKPVIEEPTPIIEEPIIEEEKVTEPVKSLETIEVEKVERQLMEITEEEIEEINELITKENISEEEYEKLQELLTDTNDKINGAIQYTTKTDNEKETKKLEEIKEKIDKNKKVIPIIKSEEELQEEKDLEEELKQEHIQTINTLLNEIHNENKEDLQNELLFNIEDLNKKSLAEAQAIEKRLLKLKLKKAAKAIEPPLLLSLPFMRNKFFFGFTAGLFLHNHLNFIDSIYDRQPIAFNPIDEQKRINGLNAMDNALALNADNYLRVQNIKRKYLFRYPELEFDPEFNNTINSMEERLAMQQNKLMTSYTRFDHTKKKINGINRKLVLQNKRNYIK